MITQVIDTRNYSRWIVTELADGRIELAPAVREIMDIRSPYAQGKIHYGNKTMFNNDMNRGIYAYL